MSSKEYWKARNYFLNNDERCRVWKEKGIIWVMHHIDPSWKTEDPERYEKWNIDDLLPMTKSAHQVIHMIGNHLTLGTHHTKEWCKKHSEDMRGANNPNYGKHLSNSVRKKLSDALQGKTVGVNNGMYGKHHTEEAKKLMSEHHADVSGKNNPRYGKHYHWYNNGITNIQADECPEGFVPGKLQRKVN